MPLPVAYSMYRLVITGSNDGTVNPVVPPNNLIGLRYVELWTQADRLGTNVAIGATITYSTNIKGTPIGTTEAEGDDLNGFGWNTGATVGGVHWVQWSLTAPAIIRSLRMRSQTLGLSSGNNIPKTGTLYGSNDGVSWNGVFEFKNLHGPAPVGSGEVNRHIWNASETFNVYFLPNMGLAPHKYHRIKVRGVGPTNATNSYVNVDKIYIYSEGDGSGTDWARAPGTTVASSSDYNSGFLAANAIGNNPSAYWASASVADLKATPATLALTLASPQTIRRVVITSKIENNHNPTDFDIQVSDDGTNWTTVRTVLLTGAITLDSKIFRLDVAVGGFSRLSDGRRTERVLVYDFITGSLIQSIVPDVEGYWRLPLDNENKVLVTHIGPSGFKPESDAPITPYAE